MGELDLLKPTIERRLGGTIHFGRVSMKPGKPTTFASIPFKPTAAEADHGAQTQQERQTKLIFSLPGNPASALVTLNLFVLPSLHKSMGLGVSTPAQTQQQSPSASLGLPLLTVTLSHTVRPDAKRTEYYRAIVTASKEDGRLRARSAGLGGPGAAVGQRSSRVEKGTRVQALMMGQIIGE
jgi:gephyrin